MQFAEEALDDLPLGHIPHGVIAEVVKYPAWHLTHSVAPYNTVYEPVAQVEQAVEPAGEYWPGLQKRQTGPMPGLEGPGL